MSKKLSSDERGVAHVLYVVLVVIVIAGIGVVGWKVASKHKSPTSGTSSTASTSSNTAASKAADSTCLATYHDTRICNFASNSTSFAKTAYTAALNITQSGATSTLTLENDGKGNTKLTGSANGQEFNSITLNGVTYVQSGGTGAWIEYPTGTTAPTTNPTSSMNIGVGSSGVTFKYLGTAACGSLTCYKYQVSDSLMPGTTQYVWFDNSSYQLRQWQATDSSGTTDMTITYGSVNITVPSPVESLSSIE
ncbi:MAG TPA: hypothetical protein VMR34_05820 [Candidatus Saccharimonadales bacterium]|nr:hypothetical protein [Candidatus Saccharimonadales bacterium]